MQTNIGIGFFYFYPLGVTNDNPGPFLFNVWWNWNSCSVFRKNRKSVGLTRKFSCLWSFPIFCISHPYNNLKTNLKYSNKIYNYIIYTNSGRRNQIRHISSSKSYRPISLIKLVICDPMLKVKNKEPILCVTCFSSMANCIFNKKQRKRFNDLSWIV